MNGYNPHQQLLEQTRGLVKKWKPTGLLEGLSGGENEVHGMSVLLENQARQLIQEASSTQAGGSGANKEEWSGVALPLVRRIFAEIAAQEAAQQAAAQKAAQEAAAKKAAQEASSTPATGATKATPTASPAPTAAAKPKQGSKDGK